MILTTDKTTLQDMVYYHTTTVKQKDITLTEMLEDFLQMTYGEPSTSNWTVMNRNTLTSVVADIRTRRSSKGK
jgi:hypothetical protein